MTDVTELDLLDHHIRDLKEVSLPSTLRTLNLHSNHISMILSDLSRRCPMLEFLNMSSNVLVSMDGVQQLSQLRVLNLASNRISSLCSINNLPNLRVLVLAHNQVSDLRPLATGSSSLRVLDLRGNRIADVGMLKNLQNLIELRVVWFQVDGKHANPVCHEVDYERTVRACCPQLEFLDSPTMDDVVNRDVVDMMVAGKYSVPSSVIGDEDEVEADSLEIPRPSAAGLDDSAASRSKGDAKVDSILFDDSSSSMPSSGPSLPTPRIDQMIKRRQTAPMAASHGVSSTVTPSSSSSTGSNSYPAHDHMSQRTSSTPVQKSDTKADRVSTRIRDEEAIIEGLERERTLRKMVEELRGQLELADSRTQSAEHSYHVSSKRLLSQLEEARQVIQEQDHRIQEEVQKRLSSENKVREAKEFLLEREQVVQKLRGAKAELDAKVRDLEDGMAKWKAAAQSQEQQAKTTSEHLATESAKLRKTVGELAKKLEDVSVANRKAVESLEADSKTLREDCARYRRSNEEFTEELVKLQRGNSHLEDRLNRAQQENASIQSQLVDLASLKARHAELQQELSRERQKVSTLDAELRIERERYATTLKEEAVLVKGLEKLKNEVIRQHSQVEVLQRDNAAKDAIVNDLKAQLQAVSQHRDSMLADASKSASAIAAVDMEKDKLRQTIGELQASLRKVVEQNDELKRALEKEVRNGAEMKHVVKVAARKAEDAENGRKELDKQVEEFRRRDLDRLSSYQQLASQFESKLAPIILENSQLKAQLAAVQMDNRLNNQGMQKNDHLLHEQQSELQHLEEKNERLQGQLDDLRRKIDERDGKLEAKRIEIRDLKESLARYDQEMSRIRKMVESERDDSVSRLREMEKRMEEERRADQEQRRLDQIEKKQSEVRMQQMSVELAEKEKSLISALADVENMKQKLSRANQETRVLVKAIDQQRALCEQKEDQIRRLQSAFRTVQVELQDTANSRHPRP